MKITKKLIYLIILSISTHFFTSLAFAWNANGHRLIANIAYLKLKPAVRDQIDDIIAHFNTEYSYIYRFEQLAPWMDSLRSQKISTFTHWHYIDVAFSDDGTPIHSLIDSDNAVWAEENAEIVVGNKKANIFERERFLAYLIHIVGDLHQPLHTVSRISANHLDGDKGGNDFIVYDGNKKLKLHQLWDGGVGAFNGKMSNKQIDMVSEELIERYPESYFGSKAFDLQPNSWVAEGGNNAKKIVYNIKEEQTISEQYKLSGKQLAEQQVTLAGYRLAHILNNLLDH